MKKSVKLLAMLVGIVAILIPQACSDVDTNDGSLEQERMEVGRALLEMSADDVAELIPYYTDDVEYHDPIVDINGIQDMAAFLNQLILGASPNLVTTIEDETLMGDNYSATWTMSGDFNGVPYQAKGISIFMFMPNSSQVYYQRDYYSEGDIMATIPGLDEAIVGFRTYYKCAVDPTFECPLPPPEPVSMAKSQMISQEISDDQFVVGRQLVEINAENWMSVLPYLESNYEYHDPIVDIYGPDTMAVFLGRLFAGSSDLYTVIEEESLVDDIYMATWTMSGEFNGAAFSAPGMSIVKFVEGTTQTYYSHDYYTEGDVMLGVPGLDEAVIGFREYYRSVVDPNYVSPQ
ncbi:nuclear transport factor 2 family protein [uncultured Draconibacterium sp.]|uniref:nuclear transport factor 2 family protein n=1 Tax=uncultured Draconibacterium sp. TaxID=1573823 RepID=UPI002AA7BA98|nr:nuclear transport factor 2 family protein [uncultured Draconibacterium sp.]